MNIWFSADTHYGHKRIIELANRPFSSVEEMDEVMIEKHNTRVKNGDRFYLVGDFAFDDHDTYLRRLNGQKFIVPGNHDHRSRLKKAPLGRRSSTS
jgi:calcineurin-like phosphoesterase family protein